MRVERAGPLFLRVDRCGSFTADTHAAMADENRHIIQAEDTGDDTGQVFRDVNLTVGTTKMLAGAGVLIDGELHAEGFCHGLG